MRFPIVIHKEADSDYGVTIPDLPGCFSAGENMDEALSMAQEAMETHIEGMLIDGEPIPLPQTIEFHMDNFDYNGGVWAIVEVDLSKLSGKTRRVNITLPERLLTMMDSYASEQGESRSGLIARATMEFIATRTV